MTVVRRCSFALAVLVSLVVLFAPGSDVPSAPPGVDKIVHFGVFALLALTGRWVGLPVLPLGLGLVAYAAASELIQAFTPLARSGDVLDFGADVLGAAVVYAVLARYNRASRSPDSGS